MITLNRQTFYSACTWATSTLVKLIKIKVLFYQFKSKYSNVRTAHHYNGYFKRLVRYIKMMGFGVYGWRC